jgi:hypothetical protein
MQEYITEKKSLEPELSSAAMRNLKRWILLQCTQKLNTEIDRPGV